MRFVRYDWAGAVLGVALPVLASVIAAWDRHGVVSVGAIASVQTSEPLLWLLDTAPLVVAAFGFAVEQQRRTVATQQTRIKRLERQRQVSILRTADELSGTALNLLSGVSALGAASARMTASVRGSIETITAISHGATAAALTAETLAGRSLEIASKPDASAEELAGALRGAAGSAKEIARIAQDQTNGIEQVLSAMNEIHFATETSTSSAHEIADAARAMARRARNLRATCGALLDAGSPPDRHAVPFAPGATPAPTPTRTPEPAAVGDGEGAEIFAFTESELTADFPLASATSEDCADTDRAAASCAG